MIRLIYFLVVATGVALIAAWFAEHPGNVQLDWQGRHIETSVGMALLLVLAAALLVSLLISLVRLLVLAPARWRQARRQARELRGYRALSNGMIAAAAGDPRAAKIHATEARRLIAQEPAVLLLSTQTAQLVGDEDAALLSYRAMLKHTETSLLATRGLLGQSVKLGDSEEALELARRAYRQNPDAPWTAATLFDLLTKDQLWPDALAVVPAMERVGAIDAEKGRRYRAVLHTLIGREQLAAKAQGEALQSAQRAVEAAPGLPPAAVLLAAAYSVLGRPTHARRALERAWSVSPHPELARAYAELVPTESAPDRLRRFDRLRQLRPDDIETRLTLAEQALAASSPETARDQLRPLLHEPTVRTCRLMAEVDQASGAAADLVSGWLARAEEAKPDTAWVCEDTGEILPAWQPFTSSGRFDGVTWATPPRLTALKGEQRLPAVTLTQSSAPPAAPANRAASSG